MVVVVGWLYIVPQLHGAALTIRITTGLPAWVGPLAVVGIVCVTVVAGGMRSITFVQAFQFWLKLTALAVPIVFLLLVLDGGEPPAQLTPAEAFPTAAGPGDLDVYRTVSLMVALLLGTLGLPHVLVRFYTNPDGRRARRTTVIVLVLLSVFYLFPTAFGFLGRAFAPDLASAGRVRRARPAAARPAGARARRRRAHGARDRRGVRGVPLDVVGARGLARGRDQPGPARRQRARLPDRGGHLGRSCRWSSRSLTESTGLAGSVGLVFAFTASTLCPMLILGIWWRGLTAPGRSRAW